MAQFTTRPCNRFEVRAAPALLPTLFPSPTGSRLSPSSSHGAIHVMAQTGRSNVRYVDPQRRYTLVLGPSWNAPIGALPHDDRAGTHDSADGQCGSYASIVRGQAATKIFRRYPQGGVSGFAALRDFEPAFVKNEYSPFWAFVSFHRLRTCRRMRHNGGWCLASHSIFTCAVWMTSPHLAESLRKYSAKASSGPGIGCTAKRSR